MNKVNAKLKTMLKLAKIQITRAHAPYSHFQVGACIQTADNKLFAGCNVENASYGGTVCAERVAIFSAVSQGGQFPIKRVLVLSSTKQAWPPCGFCRQVLAEFCSPDTEIHIFNNKSESKSYLFSELLPEAFTPQFLDNNSRQKKKA